MRKRTPATQQLEFVRDLPRKGNQFGKWMEILQPLVKKPGHWALIHTCESPLQANKLQSNLHSRKLLIPEPNHDWEFAARGSEVYAVYRGRKGGPNASLRRTYKKR